MLKAEEKQVQDMIDAAKRELMEYIDAKLKELKKPEPKKAEK